MSKMMEIIKKILNFIAKVSKRSLLHFITGLLITEVVIMIISIISHTSYGGAVAGFIVGVIAGILKEVYDKDYEGQDFEIKDFFCTIIGSLVGALLIINAII